VKVEKTAVVAMTALEFRATVPSWGAAVLHPYQGEALCDLAVRSGGGWGVQKNVEVVRVNGAEESVFALDVALAD
jgi:hypothetical protein